MRTVRFNFKKTGFNAHTASGEFTYDTPEHAQAAAEDMKKKEGFSNVRLTSVKKSVN